MSEQRLKLNTEIQRRDYDDLIAHTTSVFMCYMFLSYQCRMKKDHRSFGDLFYAHCDGIADISFIEVLFRLLTLAADKLREMGGYCEKTVLAFFLRNYGVRLEIRRSVKDQY